MPFITREDGERFVIPSYRDVLATRQKSQLKKEILLLSQNYGEYITLQKKGSMQYELAFSNDTGYLLGESVWHYFKRPLDLIYCESIPNTTEALLVIVKAGSVYLDGSFPVESIPEELIVFLTQENQFDIYVYGDVPISQEPEEGKFSFESNSVKSFNVLDAPVFQTLPLLKQYQLQLVDTVLKAQGIGTFPTKKILTIGIVIVVLWMLYSYFKTSAIVVQSVSTFVSNPYEGYNSELMSPAPEKLLPAFIATMEKIYSLPGWRPVSIELSGSSIQAQITTQNSEIEELLSFAKKNNMTVDIRSKGVFITTNLTVPNRPMPTKIYPMKDVIARLLDRLHTVISDNQFKLNEPINRGAYKFAAFTINSGNFSPFLLRLIGEQLQGLPIVVQNIKLTLDGGMAGSITLEILGS